MRVIVAIDSLKGCVTSQEANHAACAGVLDACPVAQVVSLPVSDGGEGWLDAFGHFWGGELCAVRVNDPLMRPITAHYLRKGDEAVIEVARVCGFTLLAPDERNPLVATTYGVGQMIAHAAGQGCRRFIVGLGGTATSDAGMGMMQALERSGVPRQGLQFTIATDVTNPLCGAEGAARVFAPQKGATPAVVAELDARAARYAHQAASDCGFDRSHESGAGAAGGLGYAFMQFFGAECRSGAEVLLDAAHFDRLLTDASLVITGEGAADAQTLMGKLPGAVLRRAQRHGVPTCLAAGRVEQRSRLLDAGFTRVECINPPDTPLHEAMRPAVALARLRQTAARSVPQPNK